MKKTLLLASLLAVASASFAQTAPAPQPGKPAPAHPAPPAAPHGVPMGPSAEQEMAMAQQAIANFDINKDGKVSKKEFLDAQLKTFNELDGNHDGFVVPQEMVDFHHKMMEKQMEARRALMAQLQKSPQAGAVIAQAQKHQQAGVPAGAGKPAAPQEAPKAAPAK